MKQVQLPRIQDLELITTHCSQPFKYQSNHESDCLTNVEGFKIKMFIVNLESTKCTCFSQPDTVARELPFHAGCGQDEDVGKVWAATILLF